MALPDVTDGNSILVAAAAAITIALSVGRRAGRSATAVREPAAQ